MSTWSRSDSPPPPSYHSTQPRWDVEQNTPRPPTWSPPSRETFSSLRQSQTTRLITHAQRQPSSYTSDYSRTYRTETTRLVPDSYSNHDTGKTDCCPGAHFVYVSIIILLACYATASVYPILYPPSDAALEEARQRWRLEKAKLRLYWDDLQGDDQCLGHDRVHYRALLRNVQPSVINPIDACKDTTITINGINYATPAWCEDAGNSNVYGHWIVANEAKCMSYWQYFKDKGCTARGSGTRRFEAPLSGPHWGQDQERLCQTTPATIMGQTFNSPMACPLWGKFGFWGIWDVRDDSC